jgi:hypothetical protein
MSMPSPQYRHARREAVGMDAMHFRKMVRLKDTVSAEVLLGKTHEIAGRRERRAEYNPIRQFVSCTASEAKTRARKSSS